MDPVSAQLHFKTHDLDDIVDEYEVADAEHGCADTALSIIQKCVNRLSGGKLDDEERAALEGRLACIRRHPVFEFISALAFREQPLADLRKSKLTKKVILNFRASLHRADSHRQFLCEQSDLLGSAYLGYLLNCFDRAVDEYDRPRQAGIRRRPKWLAIAFRLAPRKTDAKGWSDNQERNADIAQSVHFIFQQYQRKQGALKRVLERYVAGERTELPWSMERLVYLKGFVAGGPFLDKARTEVARKSLAIIERVESGQGPRSDRDHPAQTIASEIYAECSKACRSQLEKILDGDANNPQRIRERIETLTRYYGAADKKRGEKGISAEGIAKVYAENKGPRLLKISQDGQTVGKLDIRTMTLVEAESDELVELISDWQENGIGIPQPQGEPLQEGQACGMRFVEVPFKPKSLHIIENQLLIAGYDVAEAPSRPASSLTALDFLEDAPT